MIAVGVDVGGSKIAVAVVDVDAGTIVRELRFPTPVGVGGRRVLELCVRAVTVLHPDPGASIGIGLCEFIDLAGAATSACTVDWRALDVAAAFAELGPARLESDVRAAALAEARFGAGRGYDPLLYLVVGTGISFCAVIGGKPYAGARGNAIVVGAPPVEHLASGRALARRAGVYRAEEVFADRVHRPLIEDAARALGLALASLVNAFDPAAVVVGGGLGLVDEYRELVAASTRAAIDAETTRDVAIVPAALGEQSGVIGAALVAVGG